MTTMTNTHDPIFLFLDQLAWHPLFLIHATKIALFREKTSGKLVKSSDSAVLLTKFQFLDVFYVQNQIKERFCNCRSGRFLCNHFYFLRSFSIKIYSRNCTLHLLKSHKLHYISSLYIILHLLYFYKTSTLLLLTLYKNWRRTEEELKSWKVEKLKSWRVDGLENQIKVEKLKNQIKLKNQL